MKTDLATAQELPNPLALLLDGKPSVAAGHFDHLGWSLKAGGGTTAWTSLIASLHETCHFDLNQSTAYGALLAAQAYLTRELGGAAQMIRLRELTDRARDCHEIFATTQSLMIAQDAGVTRHAFVETYPDYEAWLTQGEALTRGLKSRFARMAALAAVIKGCFQSDVLQRVGEVGLKTYDIDDLDHSEFPDQRLQLILPDLTTDFWHGQIVRFPETETDHEAIQLLRRAETSSTDTQEADTALAKTRFEPFSTRFSEHLEGVIAELFRQRGKSFLKSRDYAAYCAPLLTQCDALAPFKNASSTLHLPSSDAGSDTDTMEAQLSETLIVGPPPPATITFFDDLPRHGWDSYVSKYDGREVIYVASRTKEWFAQQYDLGRDELEALANNPSDYVVYMVKARLSDGQRTVDVCVFSKPGQLHLIDKIMKVGILASTSMLLLSDKDWQDTWHDQIAGAATQIVLFDLSPLDHLERSLGSLFEEICYQKYQIEQGEIEVTCLVLVGRSASMTTIFAAPCSEMVADGIIRYIETQIAPNAPDQNKWQRGGGVFDQLTDAMPLILSGLFLHETRFDFKALQSKFGAEGFRDGRFLTPDE